MPTPDTPQSPLPYEQTTPGVTRRSFRLLLILTFINTILLGISLMGPQTYQQAMKAYTDWKTRREASIAEAKKKAQQAADVAQSRTFTFPKDYVAYTEDQAEATKLLYGGKRYAAKQLENAPPGWQSPVLASDVSPLLVDGLVFLHERKTPSGIATLVSVKAISEFDFDRINEMRQDGLHIQYELGKKRQLRASAETIGPDMQLTKSRGIYLDLHLPDDAMRPVSSHKENENLGAVDLGHTLRFLGGAPDPNDPTRFTIDYELDGKPGTIDGWLTEDAIVLQPREGKAIGSASQRTWNLLAAGTSPTSAPASKSGR